MNSQETSSASQTILAVEDEAASIFVQRHHGEWTAQDQSAFETRLLNDHAFAQAYQRVDESWRALGTHAETPELMTYRAEAIDTIRRANSRRWLQPRSMKWLGQKWKVAAAVTGLAMLGTVWQLSPYGYRPGEYRTAIGEQRIVELEDHTRITIDAATHLKVRFTDDTRTVQLLEGQAQFSVAKDPARPFKVIAGERTIVAIGTVFTVEYVDRHMQVAMVEGEVAVLASSGGGVTKHLSAATQAASASSQHENEPVYLTAGESLRVTHGGEKVFTSKADIEAATAWREGKVIFRTTPLGDAVSRMNRYSQLQLQIDDELLAAQHISGVFEAGDTLGFVDALERYLPVSIDYLGSDTVRLRLRKPTSSLTADASVPPG